MRAVCVEGKTTCRTPKRKSQLSYRISSANPGCCGSVCKQCVQSVLDTRGWVRVRILVVDDGSPRPAEEEIGDLVDAETVTIIQQENAGPAAARNTGLDYAGDVPFVTFLDSDDQWTGPFLQDAVRALEQGYDLFVGDSKRGGGTCQPVSDTSRGG